MSAGGPWPQPGELVVFRSLAVLVFCGMLAQYRPALDVRLAAHTEGLIFGPPKCIWLQSPCPLRPSLQLCTGSLRPKGCTAGSAAPAPPATEVLQASVCPWRVCSRLLLPPTLPSHFCHRNVVGKPSLS